MRDAQASVVCCTFCHLHHWVPAQLSANPMGLYMTSRLGGPSERGCFSQLAMQHKAVDSALQHLSLFHRT